MHLNAHGGAPLCTAGGKARPATPEAEDSFLDPETQRVKVAPRREFVGRRREIQAILRAFASGERVLIRGMGNLGKSSVAARVAGRVRGLTPVVIFEHYDAESIFEAVCKRLPAAVKGRLVAWQQQWKPQIAEDGALLEIVLQELLEGIKVTDAAGAETVASADILLIIDDLERALEEPTASEEAALGPRNDKMRVALGAVLRAFAQAHTRSRLLFTSRYDMALVDGSGRDLASEARLTRVALKRMEPRTRDKQLRAFARAQGLEEGLTEDALRWLDQAAEAAGGNPWIQRILQEPILRGEQATVEGAIEALKTYRREGIRPEDGSEVTEFLAKEIIDRLGRALTDGQRKALRACSLFTEGVPIPMAALEAVAAEAGADDPAAALTRLRALGLLEPWGEISNQPHAALNPLARGVTGPIDEDGSNAKSRALAGAAMRALSTAWRDAEGRFPYDRRGEEAARLAITAGAGAEILEAALESGTAWLWRVEDRAEPALALLLAGLAALPEGHALDADLIRTGVEAADRLGQGEVLDGLLALRVRQSGGNDPAAQTARARLDLRRVERLMRAGDPDAAMGVAEAAHAVLKDLPGEDRLAAIAQGKIADILEARGQLDAALKIREEEQLPVYTALQDRRSIAVTKGKIADILEARGELDAALKIREEEELPVFTALGDILGIAITERKIGDIEARRGEPDKALARYEKAIEIVEPLGAVRDVAVFQGCIADILEARGQLGAALKIREEEQLPVYTAFQDRRSIAVTKGKIADILQARGQLDAALKIREEEQLPVFTALQDRREIAVTKGKIADILEAKGDQKAADRIRRDEELPTYEALGAAREAALVRVQLAQSALRQGGDGLDLQAVHDDLHAAFRTFCEMRAPKEVGGTGSFLAQVLAMGNAAVAALEVLDITAAAFEALDDQAGLAHVADLRRIIEARNDPSGGEAGGG